MYKRILISLFTLLGLTPLSTNFIVHADKSPAAIVDGKYRTEKPKPIQSITVTLYQYDKQEMEVAGIGTLKRTDKTALKQMHQRGKTVNFHRMKLIYVKRLHSYVDMAAFNRFKLNQTKNTL